jgi:hypothetical protein
MEKKLLNLAQAGRIIGMTRGGVHDAVKRGALKADRHGPYPLVSEEDALHYKQHRPGVGRPKKILQQNQP